jgi:hypothetical protein
MCNVMLGCATFIAVRFGYSQPDTISIEEIQPCGEAICFLGIEVGVTEWFEALRRVRSSNHFEPSNFADTVFRHIDPPYTLGLLDGSIPAEQPLVVIELNIALKFDTLLLGDIVRKYGPPCNVFMLSRWGVAFGYANATFMAQVGSTLTLTTPISHMVFRSIRTNNCLRKIPAGQGTNVYQWKGFTNYQRLD